VDQCATQVRILGPATGQQRLAGSSGTLTALAYSKLHGRTVVLQVAAGPDWVPVASLEIPASVSTEWTRRDLAYPVELAGGAQSFRIHIEPAAECVAVDSEPLTMTFLKAAYAFSDTYTAHAGAKNVSLSTMSAVTVIANARAQDLDGIQTSGFVFQRSVAGGPWEDLANVAVKVEPEAGDPTLFGLKAEVPRLSANSKRAGVAVAYRFASTATATVEPTASNPVKIDYFNSRSVIRKAIKRYCPSTKITFVNKPTKAMKEKWAGYYTWGKNRIVMLTTEFDDRDSIEWARFAATHECGHRLQEVTYKSSGAADKAAKKVFGTNHKTPLEHWADCVAYTQQKFKPLPYGGKCTAKQLKAAKKTLKKKRLY
jgi:hypothetical protein